MAAIGLEIPCVEIIPMKSIRHLVASGKLLYFSETVAQQLGFQRKYPYCRRQKA